MVKCPYCGYKGEFILLKTWKYSFWDVELYKCPKCNGKFRYQHGISPKGKKSEYIMRVSKIIRRKQ